jgi:hypothetical protein
MSHIVLTKNTLILWLFNFQNIPLLILNKHPPVHRRGSSSQIQKIMCIDPAVPSLHQEYSIRSYGSFTSGFGCAKIRNFARYEKYSELEDNFRKR